MNFFQNNRTKIFLSSVIILSIVIPIFPYSNTNAETVAELKEQISETNQEKARIEAEIEKYKKELTEVGAEKDTLSNKIKSLEITQKKLSADISLTQNRISSASFSIAELTTEVKKTEKKIDNNNMAIAKTIRNINMTENVSFIETLLTKDSHDLWNEIGSLEQLQNGLRTNVSELQKEKERYLQQKIEQENKRKELLELQSELGDRKDIIDQNKKEQNSLLTETASKETEYKRILAEKESLRKKFEEELAEYENQIKYILNPSKLPPAGSGVLSWPLDTVFLTQKFGVTSFSGRLYTSGSHNGIDFRAAIGTRVLSAGDGVIVGTGDTDVQKGCYSYGKWVLVEHTNGLSTVYGHLSRIPDSVIPGKTVKAGDVIAYSGSTGYSTGPHLHLSVFAPGGVQIGRNVNSKYCKSVSIPLASPQAYLDPLLYL